MSAGEGTFTPPLQHRTASDAVLARHDCTACQVRQVCAADGRFKVGGANVNFIIYYEVDDDNSKHALSLAAFGEDKDWVLLEKA